MAITIGSGSFHVEDFFIFLENTGIIELALPFIFLFTIIFGILQLVHIFGDDSRKYNIVIALVMAGAAIYGHVAGYQPDIVQVMYNVLPRVSIWLIAGLSALLLMGLFGMTSKNVFFYKFRKWVPWIAFLVIAYIFFGEPILGSNLSIAPEFVGLVLTLAVFGLIVWFITRDTGDDFIMGKDKEGNMVPMSTKRAFRRAEDTKSLAHELSLYDKYR